MNYKNVPVICECISCACHVYFQRVEPEYIKSSVERLYLVIDKINTFVLLIRRLSDIKLPRISDCLKDLLESVLHDMTSMHKIFVDYTIWNKSYRSASPAESQYFWGGTFATFPASVSATNVTQVQAIRNQHMLPVYLDILSSMDTDNKNNVRNTTDRHTRNDEFEWRQCQKIYQKIKQIMVQQILGNTSERGKDATNDSDQNYFHDVYDLHRMHLFYGCHNLGVVIHGLIQELKKVFTDTEEPLHTGQGMDEEGYWNILSNDVDNLKFISVWLSSQLISYAANKTTKIELSDSIGPHILSSVELSLDRLTSAITAKGIAPLLTKASKLGKNMPKWYKNALGILQMSIPNYEDRGVKYLHIWRHPVALLETEEMLKFKFSVFDAWRSWEMSTTLDNFIVSGNAGKLISNVTQEFTNTLFHELLRLQMQLKRVRNEAMQSIGVVISDFTDIQREKSTDEKFVL